MGKVGKWARLGIIIVAALLILNLFDTPLDAFIQAIGAVCAVLAIGFVATWSTLSNFPLHVLSDPDETVQCGRRAGNTGR